MSRPTFTGFEKSSEEQASSKDEHDEAESGNPADAYVDTWYQVLKARSTDDEPASA
jgi:hypothetical protein